MTDVLSVAVICGPQTPADAAVPAVRVRSPWTGYLLAAVEAHGWKSLKPFCWDGQTLSWPQRAGARVVAVRLREEGGWLTATASEIRADSARIVARAVRRVLFLDVDFRPFHDICERFPDSRPIAQARRGPLLRAPSAFEDAAKTLLTTNVTWVLTKRMAGELCHRFGGPGGAFPSPEALAACSEGDLRAAGLGYRAAYVRALAQRVATNDLDLDALEATDDPRPVLRTIRGFGPYAVAHMAQLLGWFGDIPVDSWALGLASRHLVAGRPATAADIRRHFARFGGWQALAFRHYPWGGLCDEPADW